MIPEPQRTYVLELIPALGPTDVSCYLVEVIVREWDRVACFDSVAAC